jgi:hypothetical protein
MAPREKVMPHPSASLPLSVQGVSVNPSSRFQKKTNAFRDFSEVAK